MRKALSVILCFCILFGMMSYADIAFASCEKLEDDVNPFFSECRDDIPESNRMLPYTLKSSSDYVENKIVYKDCKSAAMFLRDCMVKRVPKVIFCISKNPTDNLINVHNATINDSYYSLHGAFSYEVSSSDSDGDYLALSYAGTKNSYRQDYGTYYKYTYNIFYRTTAKEEQVVDSYVKALVKNLKAQNLTRLELVKAVHDEICKITSYDEDNYKNGYNRFSNVNTAYSAIADKLTMCSGYSMLFYRICTSLNIPVRIVQSKTHAWNIVKPVTGKYYYNIDVTWDDNYSFPDENAAYGCDYYLKCDSEVISKKSHRGYLPSENEDHVRINEFANDYFNKTYPISSSSFYLNKDGEAQCAYCGSIVDDAAPTPSDHIYSVTVTKPSCIADGKRTYHCTHCSESFTERIPQLNHSFNNSTKYCSVCKAVNPFYVEPSTSSGEKSASGSNEGGNNSSSSGDVTNSVPVLKATKIISAKPKGRKVILKWKKRSNISGYQIQYSTTKKFKKKNTKRVTVKNSAVTSKKVKIKIKKKKKFYFRVRTYRTIGDEIHYSKWSKSKIVKLR